MLFIGYANIGIRRWCLWGIQQKNFWNHHKRKDSQKQHFRVYNPFVLQVDQGAKIKAPGSNDLLSAFKRWRKFTLDTLLLFKQGVRPTTHQFHHYRAWGQKTRIAWRHLGMWVNMWWATSTWLIWHFKFRLKLVLWACKPRLVKSLNWTVCM